MGLLVSNCTNPCQCGGTTPPPPIGTAQYATFIGSVSQTSISYSASYSAPFDYSGPSSKVELPGFTITGTAKDDYFDPHTGAYQGSLYPQSCVGYWKIGAVGSPIEGQSDGIVGASGAISWSFSGAAGDTISVNIEVSDWTTVPIPPGAWNPIYNPSGWETAGVSVVLDPPPDLGTQLVTSY